VKAIDEPVTKLAMLMLPYSRRAACVSSKSWLRCARKSFVLLASSRLSSVSFMNHDKRCPPLYCASLALAWPKRLTKEDVRYCRHNVRATLYNTRRRQFTMQHSVLSRATNNWQPGTEPGVDPNDNEEDCFREDAHALHQDCTVTVHEFSPSRLLSHDLDNTTLESFLARNPRRPWWAEVRWINVDGISWDIIRILGREKGLHRLAIEDLMNKKNRSKVDWYPDAAFGA